MTSEKLLLLGVDPGLSGAMAIIDPLTHNPVGIFDMPTHEIKGKRRLDLYGLAEILREYAPKIRLALIEQVASAPKQGLASTFAFGESFGVIQGIVAALQIPMLTVRPAAWKIAFGLGPDKDQSRQMASRMFPMAASHLSRKMDHNRAEAMLIAAYASNIHSVQKALDNATPDIN